MQAAVPLHEGPVSPATVGPCHRLAKIVPPYAYSLGYCPSIAVLRGAVVDIYRGFLYVHGSLCTYIALRFHGAGAGEN